MYDQSCKVWLLRVTIEIKNQWGNNNNVENYVNYNTLTAHLLLYSTGQTKPIRLKIVLLRFMAMFSLNSINYGLFRTNF